MACDLSLTASLTLRERSFWQCLCDSSCSRVGELVRRWALRAHCRSRASPCSPVVLPPLLVERQASARRLVSGNLTSLAPPPLCRTRHEPRSGTPESQKHTLICLFLLRLLSCSIRINSTLPYPSCLIRRPAAARLLTASVEKFSCVSVFLSLSFTYLHTHHTLTLTRHIRTSHLEFTTQGKNKTGVFYIPFFSPPFLSPTRFTK